MAGEEGMIIDLINTIKGTETSAELSFEELKVSIPGFRLGLVVSGKVNLTIRAVSEK